MNHIISWFATNHVASNLLVSFAVLSGLAAFTRIAVQPYPDLDVPIIAVTVAYRGAAPEEVESGVCMRIEERVDGIAGVEEVRSKSEEGRCVVEVRLLEDADSSQALNDVQNQVNAIDTLPVETEKPIIRLLQAPTLVSEVAVTGPSDERTLKELARRVRADILVLPGITQAEVANVRPYEISVEVSEASLLRNNLTFDQVANAVRGHSVDLPGGAIKAERGEVVLRTRGQAYDGADLNAVPVATRGDGTRVLLEDVASVVDGFADSSQRFVFDGAPAAVVQVFRVGDQDLRQIAQAVRDFVAESASEYPDGVKLTVWNDESTLLRDRLGALVDSGLQGLLMVLVILALFLRPHLALWVAAGIPIALLGAVFLLLCLDVSINAISVMGFILVLGLLVDDAVIVGEAIYVDQRSGAGQLAGAIQGARRVMQPVTFGVLTTVAAFAPLLFATGILGTLMADIAVVVVCCLIYSLIECTMVLPSHLGRRSDSMPLGEFGIALLAAAVLAAFAFAASLRIGFGLAIGLGALIFAAHLWGALSWLGAAFASLQLKFERGLESFIDDYFRRTVRAALGAKSVTVTAGLAVVLLAIALVAAGHVPFTFFTPEPGDRVVAKLTLRLGVNETVMQHAMRRLRDTAVEVKDELEREYGEPVILHIVESYGEHAPRFGDTSVRAAPSSHLGEVTLQLTPTEQRPLSTEAVAEVWRLVTGDIAEAVELEFITARRPGSPDIEIRVYGDDMDELRTVATMMRSELAAYPGVIRTGDSFREGKEELLLSLTPAGAALGLTLADLGRQVRQAYYGEEAQRVQRGQDDVRIMVRYPQDARGSLDTLESLRIRTADGGEVPFRTAAEARWGRGASTIARVSGMRMVDVTAEVDVAQTSAGNIIAAMREGFFDETFAAYPNLRYSIESDEATRQTTSDTAPLFVMAMFVIFALLATPLRSYAQPLIIMAALPFCFVGGVVGHLVMMASGAIHGMSMPAMFGLIAAIGVAVNATLLLLHSVNRFRGGGYTMEDALENAAVSRCRPILITTATTFFGLTPLMLSNSPSIAMMIPMVVSLAYGVLFSSIATLLFVPAFWLLLHGYANRAKRVTLGLVDLVGTTPRLSKWLALYPYVRESLESQEFRNLMIDDEDLDPEMARIARVGLVRLYYQREFDRRAMREQLDTIAERAPSTDDLVGEVRTWAQQRSFQIGVHMLRGVIAPVEAAGTLTDILDVCLVTLLGAARRDFERENGALPDNRIALVALDAAGRREFATGGPLRILFLYDCAEPLSTTTTAPDVWHAQLLQRFMRLFGECSPAGILFDVRPPGSLSVPDQDAPAYPMTIFESYCRGEPSLADVRMLVHARIIQAQGDLTDRFHAARIAALSHMRDRVALARELSALRCADPATWDARTRAGGLVDLELAAEYLRLTDAAEGEEVDNGLAPTFEAAAGRGRIEADAGRDLAEAARLWQNLEGFMRMASSDDFDPNSISSEQREALAEMCGVDGFEALTDAVDATARRTIARVDELFGVE